MGDPTGAEGAMGDPTGAEGKGDPPLLDVGTEDDPEGSTVYGGDDDWNGNGGWDTDGNGSLADWNEWDWWNGDDDWQEKTTKQAPKKQRKKAKKAARAKKAKARQLAKAKANESALVSLKSTKKKKKAGPSHVVLVKGKKTAGSPKTVLKPEDVVVDIPTSGPDLRCSRCKCTLEPARAQIVGKSAGTWRCNRCNTRGVQLSRIPTWKTFQGHLKTFSEDEKKSFWEQCKDCENPVELTKLITRSQTKRHSEESHTSTEGEYLPLGVYKARGFNIKRIKKYCKDIKIHETLGKTYRVKIDGKGSLSKDEEVDEENLSKRQRVGGSASSSGGGGPSGAVGSAESPDVANMPLGGEAPSKKDIGLANRVLLKLATVITPFATSLKSKHCAKLPPMTVAEARTTVDDLVKMEQKAQAVVRGGAPLTPSMADCNELVPRQLVIRVSLSSSQEWVSSSSSTAIPSMSVVAIMVAMAISISRDHHLHVHHHQVQLPWRG